MKDEAEMAVETFLNNGGERASKYLKVLEEMLGDERWRYAESTLLGIYEYVEKSYSITDAQVRAVDNIRAKPSSPYGSRRRRRY